jgi:glucose/mannose transport system permease protein
MWHSLQIAVTTTFFATIFGILGGYVLARGRFRGVRVIFGLVLFGIYIPGITKMLPTLKMIQFLGLYDTDFGVGLAVGSMMLPMSTILYRQFYLQIPQSFYEMASLSGANHLDILTRIVVPLSKVPSVTVAVLSLAIGWNVYLLPLILTTGSPFERPIAVTLAELKEEAMQYATFSDMLAAGVLAAIPPVILYLIAQRYVTAGFRHMGGLDK